MEERSNVVTLRQRTEPASLRWPARRITIGTDKEPMEDEMAKRAKGWSDFNTDEKLEALRQDVNMALDLIASLRKQLDRIAEAPKHPS